MKGIIDQKILSSLKLIFLKNWPNLFGIVTKKILFLKNTWDNYFMGNHCFTHKFNSHLMPITTK
jgi:hypothetical protein